MSRNVSKRLRKIIYKHFPDALELGDDYRVPCIWHKENDPSLSIDRETGLFQCFGCGKAGNYDTLLKALGEKDTRRKIKAVDSDDWSDVKKKLDMETEGISSRSKYGMPFGFKRFSESNMDNRYYVYMVDRGFSLSTLELFKAGYVPANVNSRYKGRVVVPVHDEKGKLYFPEARAIEDDGNGYFAKYMRPKKKNKGEMLSKNVLFNFHRVKNSDWVIIVEGITDCMTIFGEWKMPCVAGFNPRLSNFQIKLLSRFNKIYFCFDNDNAGRIGEEYAVHGDSKGKSIPLKGKGIELWHIHMPKKKDANSISFNKFNKLLRNSKLIEV